jgi:acetylornithine deacetylase
MVKKMPPLREAIAQLVAAPSVSSTQPEWDQGNRDVIDRLADWCESLGFMVRVLPVAAARGKFNLVARAGPDVSGGLVMSGHSDTVPYDKARWSSDPFQVTERDNRWYGLGICDMKAFFALVLQASADLLPYLKRPLTLIATADEESSMSGIRALLPELESLGKYVLIGEPTALRPIFAHKGIMMEELLIEGRSGHSSEPTLGINAIDAMTEALQILKGVRRGWEQKYRQERFKVPAATLNFGCLHGGDNPNRICPSCRLQFDVRLMPGMNIASVREEIQAALLPLSATYGVNFSLRALFAGAPPFAGREDDPFVRHCEQVSRSSAGTVAFATEAPFFQEAGMSAVVLGPGNIEQAHQPDEYLSLDRINPALELFSQLIRDICIDDRIVGASRT